MHSQYSEPGYRTAESRQSRAAQLAGSSEALGAVSNAFGQTAVAGRQQRGAVACAMAVSTSVRAADKPALQRISANAWSIA